MAKKTETETRVKLADKLRAKAEENARVLERAAQTAFEKSCEAFLTNADIEAGNGKYDYSMTFKTAIIIDGNLISTVDTPQFISLESRLKEEGFQVNRSVDTYKGTVTLVAGW